jgi:hypothetical protein
VSPVRYELGSYIPVDDILHCHRRENLTPFIALTRGVLHNHRCENLKVYTALTRLTL